MRSGVEFEVDPRPKLSMARVGADLLAGVRHVDERDDLVEPSSGSLGCHVPSTLITLM